MSATPPFGTQIIGQTEKALNAILGRLLAGSDVTEPQWVALTLVAMGGGSVERSQLTARVGGALKSTEQATGALIGELVAAGWLEDDGSTVSATEAGRQLQTRVRSTVGEITERLWGDLPADDLATAGQVLGTVLERANAELARM